MDFGESRLLAPTNVQMQSAIFRINIKIFQISQQVEDLLNGEVIFLKKHRELIAANGELILVLLGFDDQDELVFRQFRQELIRRFFVLVFM